MLNIPALILSSIIWSLLWLLFVALCLRHFPWAMAHDYPPDMQQAAALPAPTPAQKRGVSNKMEAILEDFSSK